MKRGAELLRQHPTIGPLVVRVEELQSRDPVYGEIEVPLPSAVDSYLKRKGIRLYRHQAEAVNLLRAGRNVVITTGTASGKTLAFNVPVFSALADDPEATALYLYPMKALANDQIQSLREMETALGADAYPAVYDGDTAQGKRRQIRDRARIVVSNPHEIHQVLAWRSSWDRILRNLKFVVLDEAHRYRGVFGANVAMLIRRLRRLCALYGAAPQFVVSTATIGNPLEFSRRLVGVDFEAVRNDGSPRGRKEFVLVNPHIDPEGSVSTHQVASQLLGTLIREGIQAICFTPSRRIAELIARWTRDDLAVTGADQAKRVTSYRAGYSPQERRTIEAQLRNGTLLGVAATTALEVGIDVGSLGGIIIDGYPGTVTSTWQQAGRAGRGRDDSIAVLVARRSQLDQYVVNHPEMIFGQQGEQAVIDTQNQHILMSHLMCATAEAPVTKEECTNYFGPSSFDLIAALERRRLVSTTPRGWVFCGRVRPAEAVSLDGMGVERFKFLAEGKLLEVMDRARAFRDAHKGAVLLRLGETYVVDDLDLATGTIHSTSKDVDYHTQSVAVTDIRIVSETSRVPSRALGTRLGNVRVTTRYTSYKIKKFDQVLGREPLDLPPLEFDTRGVWFNIPLDVEEVLWHARRTDPDVLERLQREIEGVVRERAFAGALHALEHAMIGVMPAAIMCEKDDFGGVSTLRHPDTDQPTVFIYDAYAGGIGLSEKAAAVMPQLLRVTHELVAACPCQTGCPACVLSHRCGNDNDPMDKKGAVIVLAKLLGENWSHFDNNASRLQIAPLHP